MPLIYTEVEDLIRQGEELEDLWREIQYSCGYGAWPVTILSLV